MIGSIRSCHRRRVGRVVVQSPAGAVGRECMAAAIRVLVRELMEKSVEILPRILPDEGAAHEQRS